VVSRLQDPKVEVRSLATATLSGIIKALPPSEIETLRTSLINAVPRLFSIQGTGKKAAAGGRKRPAADVAPAAAAAVPRGLPVVAAAGSSGGGGEAAQQQQQQQGAGFLAEAQAVVQGLKAFVLSAPYDVPGWMPQVLMALVTAANSRNPLVSLPGCFCLAGGGGSKGRSWGGGRGDRECVRG
jgi:proteasome activator subunit 4